MNLLRDTSWDTLLAFAEFARDCNFTRAALRLNISQPALHTRIANLARSVGAPLYIRRGRQIEITANGRKVERFARELIASTAAFEAELADGDAEQTVSLSAGEGTFLYLLGPGLREFTTRSQHNLRLETGDRDAALDAVLTGRVQLAVAPLETMSPGITATSLTRVGQVLALPAKHRLARLQTVRLTDLALTNLIVPPAGRPHRAMISQMLQSAQVPWQIAVEASGWELMLHFVKLGLGLAIVNASARLPAGVVSRPLPELPAIHYQVFHLSKPLPAAVAELKRALLSNADRWQE